MSNLLSFKISIPTEDGFVGRECNNVDCKRYFKIHKTSFQDNMYCPYCGKVFNKNELWTTDQLNYVKEHAVEESKAYIIGEIDKVFKNAFDNVGNSNSNDFFNISVTYESVGPYQKKLIPPPVEKKVDIEIECLKCNAKFQIYGIFGYCPCCKYDNIMIYDTNISIILSDINKAEDKNRALRHAYNDLVATFEDFCKKKNQSEKKYNFQNLESSREFFLKTNNKDIFTDISKEDMLMIKRLFQKRHVYQHNKGRIDEKYIIAIPDDNALLGQPAILDINEFTTATSVMRKMLLNTN